MTLADSSRAAVPRCPRGLALAEITLIFLVMFIQGAWPVPEVNETHYLAKAKHYWNPQWCENDFFCQSADAHQAFYWSFGWLSRWLSLPALAWVGRLLTWAMLAVAWQRLSWRLVSVRLYSVLSAALLVAGLARLHMAGEWLIGGVEAKGFAYVFVLLGLAELVVDRWNRTWLCFGAAAAFHVIVGGWSVVAAGVAWLLAGRERPSLRAMFPALLGGLAMAMIGLLPAIWLTWGVPPEIVDEANVIYVYERLPHHLLPDHFNPWFIARHEVLFVVWAVLARWFAVSSSDRRLRAFVFGCVLIAGVGVVLSLSLVESPSVAARLLRYYWFRMTDVMLPLGTALLIAANVARVRLSRPVCGGLLLFVAMAGVGWQLGDTIYYRRANFVPLADTNTVSLANWQATCAWVRENTPLDAVFIVPRMAQTFRWYAERAEVVSRKDIPQDARGIVEWWRRMQTFYALRRESGRTKWRESLNDLGSVRLTELGRQYGANYLITEAQPRLALELVGPLNPFYAVYKLPIESAGAESNTK